MAEQRAEQKTESRAMAPIDIVKKALASIAGLLAKQPVILYIEWIPHAGFVPGQPPKEVGEMIRRNASVQLARGELLKVCLPVPDTSKRHWACYVRVVEPGDGFLVVHGDRQCREHRERDLDDVGGVVVAVSRGDFGWNPVPPEAKPNA